MNFATIFDDYTPTPKFDLSKPINPAVNGRDVTQLGQNLTYEGFLTYAREHGILNTRTQGLFLQFDDLGGRLWNMKHAFSIPILKTDEIVICSEDPVISQIFSQILSQVQKKLEKKPVIWKLLEAESTVSKVALSALSDTFGSFETLETLPNCKSQYIDESPRRLCITTEKSLPQTLATLSQEGIYSNTHILCFSTDQIGLQGQKWGQLEKEDASKEVQRIYSETAVRFIPTQTAPKRTIPIQLFDEYFGKPSKL